LSNLINNSTKLTTTLDMHTPP